MRRQRLGLIVNPVAGMGGRVGLKGTDGAAAVEEARRRGAQPLSPERARQALRRLAASVPDVELLTSSGEMGEASAAACNLRAAVVWKPPTGLDSVHPSGADFAEISVDVFEASAGAAGTLSTIGIGAADSRSASGAADESHAAAGNIADAPRTSAADTRAAAAAFVEAGIDLLLFAGGDGTARDIHDAVGRRVPVLGIPTGVKMHSAVFATTPAAAGDIAAAYLREGEARVPLRNAEIMDIDEEAARQGRVSARLHGYARSPYERRRVQNAKARAPADDAELEALCAEIAGNIERGRLYIVGPGTTTQRMLANLGLEGTLLGVDAVQDGALLARDAGEKDLLALLDGRPATLVLGVVGGQGFLLGRGNQQIGPEVVRRVGRENILVLATTTKIISLPEARLFVDTGEEAADRGLAGFIRVHTGPGRSLICRVSA